jgi:class 3 adenylate cyclase/tetratricopeptide (TPR) repeat protein
VICGTCQAENPASNRFCGNCGSALVSTCPRCQYDNPPGQRYCGNCGNLLGGRADEPRIAGTERRLVSVLFADLTGYTSFAEGRDSEDTRRFLGSYFEQSRVVIERFGGVVEKFIGDAVMAAWGADVAHEDDAERAVRAGFELLDIVAKLAADENAPDLALRVGVNTGEAAVGPGQEHMGFVTGDLVNTASRLEAAAEPGTILVGELTMKSAGRAIAFEGTGDLELKGKSVPVAAWKALRVLSEVGGKGRASTLEPPFVGRAEELRLLKDLLATVGREKRARLVSFVGEAGIGKSRLMWEFLKYIDGIVADTYWHEGRSPAYGDGVTFFAVSEMVRRRAGIAETDPDDVGWEKLKDTLETYIEDKGTRAWITPRIAAVLGLADAPPGDRAEMEAAVRAFFEGVATKGPAVLVFEDLHWADDSVLDFVEELTDWWRDQPILVVTLSRPDLLRRRPDWASGRPGVLSTSLSPLSDQEMEKMVRGTVALLSDDAVSLIVERSAGVPLYAVELIRSIVAHSDEGYEVTGELNETTVPESLQAVIGARLDRLEPDLRNLLQDAAVLGQSFSVEALTRITGESAQSLEQRLQMLGRQELIEPERDFLSPDHGQYHFIQGLIRDVALGRMSKEARRQRHLAVAELMEAQLDPEIAAVVAAHYLHALEATPPGDEHDAIRSKALASMRAAADRASDLFSVQQVISIADQGIALARTEAERAPFQEHLVFGYTQSGNLDKLQEVGGEVYDYYRSVGSDADGWRVLNRLGLAYTDLNFREMAVDLLGPIVDEQDDLAIHPELTRCAIVLCRARMLLFQPIADLIDRAVLAAERQGLTLELLDGLITKAIFADSSGRWTEAKILLEGVIEAADENGFASVGSRAVNNLGFIYQGVDEIKARHLADEAMELARKSRGRAFYLWHLGQACLEAGFYGNAEEYEKVASDPMMADIGPDAEAGRLGGQAYFDIWHGDLESASQHFEQAFKLVGSNDPQVELEERSSRAMMDLFDGRPQDAWEWVQNAAAHTESWYIARFLPVFTLCIAIGHRKTDGATELADVLANYPPAYSHEIAFLRAYAAMGSDPQTGLDVIDEMIGRARELESPTRHLTYLIAALTGLASDNPRRSEYRAQADRLIDENGFGGFARLIERYVD